MEGIPNIAMAHFLGEVGLARGSAYPQAGIGQHREVYAVTEAAGNFLALVEAAFSQAVAVQGQRHQGVPLVCNRYQQSGEGLGKKFCQAQFGLKFERLDQPIHRMRVAPSCPSTVEMWRVLLAAGAGQAS